MYHLVQGNGTEYLTENDSLASMASQEGFDVFTDLEPDEINGLLEYHADWKDVTVKN